jgi:hypothetical protein
MGLRNLRFESLAEFFLRKFLPPPELYLDRSEKSGSNDNSSSLVLFQECAEGEMW